MFSLAEQRGIMGIQLNKLALKPNSTQSAANISAVRLNYRTDQHKYTQSTTDVWSVHVSLKVSYLWEDRGHPGLKCGAAGWSFKWFSRQVVGCLLNIKHEHENLSWAAQIGPGTQLKRFKRKQRRIVCARKTRQSPHKNIYHRTVITTVVSLMSN